MASTSVPAQIRRCDRMESRTFRGGTSDWHLLQPIEQVTVILNVYQQSLLPELAHGEKLLTRLAVEFGLEYCGIEQLAVFFLDAARAIDHHVGKLQESVAWPVGEVPSFDLAVGNTDMSRLIERLDFVVDRYLADGQTSPYFARLIQVLRNCQRELVNLVDLEAELSRSIKP